MRKVVSVVLVLLLIILTGCATLRGMGEDAENLGKGIKKTVAE